MQSDHFFYFEGRIAELVAAGKICVTTEEAVLNLLNRKFPMGFNRIEWEKIPNAKFFPLERDRQISLMSLEIDKIFEEFALDALLDPVEIVTIVGDGPSESAFEMSVEVAAATFSAFCLLPQSTYLVTSTGQWCLNCTYQREIFYGSST